MYDTLPLAAGIGLKPRHFPDAAASGNTWYEVHAENYLMAGGPMLDGLMQVRERHGISLHCVGMSPGSADGIDAMHVRRIKSLCDRLQPALVSDHLAWTRWGNHSLNDLLPLPYSHEALAIVAANVDHIQQLLGRTIAIENPSVYMPLAGGDMDEVEFLTALARRTGCSVLLDINNLVVNTHNTGLDAARYLQRLPPALVAEFHLAGHKAERHGSAVLCIDDHGSAVGESTWQLYRQALALYGPRPTLIEWDTDVPAFATLQDEAAKADRLLALHTPAPEQHRHG